jgi:hypothetical protein
MFVCDPCAKEHDWPLAPAITMSYGPCECCHTTTGCNDLRSDIDEMPDNEENGVRKGYEHMMWLTALTIWGTAKCKAREEEVRGTWPEIAETTVKVKDMIGPLLKGVDTA